MKSFFCCLHTFISLFALFLSANLQKGARDPTNPSLFLAYRFVPSIIMDVFMLENRYDIFGNISLCLFNICKVSDVTVVTFIYGRAGYMFALWY